MPATSSTMRCSCSEEVILTAVLVDFSSRTSFIVITIRHQAAQCAQLGKLNKCKSGKFGWLFAFRRDSIYCKMGFSAPSAKHACFNEWSMGLVVRFVGTIYLKNYLTDKGDVKGKNKVKDLI